MLYYKTSSEQREQLWGWGVRSWAEFGQNRPVLRKLTIFLLFAVTIFMLLGGFAPAQTSNYLKSATNVAKSAVTSH